MSKTKKKTLAKYEYLLLRSLIRSLENHRTSINPYKYEYIPDTRSYYRFKDKLYVDADSFNNAIYGFDNKKIKEAIDTDKGTIMLILRNSEATIITKQKGRAKKSKINTSYNVKDKWFSIDSTARTKYKDALVKKDFLKKVKVEYYTHAIGKDTAKEDIWLINTDYNNQLAILDEFEKHDELLLLLKSGYFSNFTFKSELIDTLFAPYCDGALGKDSTHAAHGLILPPTFMKDNIRFISGYKNIVELRQIYYTNIKSNFKILERYYLEDINKEKKLEAKKKLENPTDLRKALEESYNNVKKGYEYTISHSATGGNDKQYKDGKIPNK